MNQTDDDKEILDTIERLSVPILDSISAEAIENFQPYHERYYDNRYCTSFNTEAENHDVILRFHTNKLVLISIAHGHDIFRHNYTIERINFNINGEDRSNITISGKKKAGAKKLSKNTILCSIKCKDVDKEYPVYCCIPASLIEVNHLVVENPNLLITNYKKLGYIAVLNPQRFGRNSNSIDNLIVDLKLLTEEDYKAYVKSRVDGKT